MTDPLPRSSGAETIPSEPLAQGKSVPWKFNFISLVGVPARLFLMLFLFVVPIFFLVMANHREREQEEAQESQREALLVARLAAERVETVLESTRHLLAAYAQLEVLRQGPAFEAERLLRKLQPLHPYFINIGVIGMDGMLRVSALPFSKPVHLGHRAYFERAVASNGFALGDFQVGTVTNKPTLNCAFPIRNVKGQITGVVYTALDLSMMEAILRSLPLPEGGRLSLVDGGGSLLASSDASWTAGTLIEARGLTANAEAGGAVEPSFFVYNDEFVVRHPLNGNIGLGLIMLYDVPSSLVYRAGHKELTMNLIVFGLVVLGSMGFAWVSGHHFVALPIGKLLRATERLTEGDMAARTGLGKVPGELGRLAKAIDTMAVRLEEREHALIEAREGLERQVQDRTKDLADTNQQLEIFGYSVSHDLRAPLRAIDGFSQILLNEHAAGLTPEGRRILNVIVKNTQQMSALIDDLMAFAKLGRQPVSPSSIDVGTMVRDIQQELTAAQPAHPVRWDIGPLPPAWGDAGMIRQVFTNLIANAFKYTSQTGAPVIEISGSSENGMTQYVIRDNGAGFDPRYAARLFQPFQRLHAAHEFDGTGVGLAIVHRVIVKHGGKVSAEGQPRQGAVFTFSLPVSPP